MNKLQGNRIQARSNSISGAVKRNTNNNIRTEAQKPNDDSLFQQFGNTDSFQPGVIEISEA